MAEAFIYDKDKMEKKMLITQAKDEVAFCSDDIFGVNEFEMMDDAVSFLEEKSDIDFAMIEISRQEEISLPERLRSKQENVEVMLIADVSISPMKYLTPRIRAASLLLRPYSKEQAKQTIKDFVSSYYRKQESLDEGHAIVIENRQGKIKIPYLQIYYLEIREKKVYIRLRDKEYSQYDSLENISKALPDYFKRCHRSFICNMKYFERVKLSENTIYLAHGVMVPLSRSYKADIKEYLDGLQT